MVTNNFIRPAGSGIIVKDAEPIKRGVWDLYETTNPRIGIFDTSFWIELSKDKSSSDEALDELATFLRDNVKSNVVVLEHSHVLIMGGFGSGEAAGKNFLDKKRRIQSRRESMIEGYEIRLMYEDAVTFLALWRGHDKNDDQI